MTRIFLCGGGALAPGLPEALQAAVGVETSIADPWHGVDAAGESPRAPDALFVTACGLALKAAGRATIDVNLTPTDVRDRRATRRRAGTMTATAITAGVIVAACAVAGWLLLTAKLNYADQLAKEVEGLGGAAQEIALSEADLQRYGEVETDINRALRRDSRPLDIVHDITVDMPQDVWVTEFSYDAAKNVVVRGTALNGPSVADSVRALLNTERFADVVLDYYNLGQVADKPVYNFQISCKFPAEVAQ